MTEYGVICKQCLRPAYLEKPVANNEFVCNNCLATNIEYDKGFTNGLWAGVSIASMVIALIGIAMF